MNALKLKPTYKVVKAYYSKIDSLAQLRLFDEGAVSPAFAAVLRYCAGQFNWTLAEQYRIARGDRTIVVDGALLDTFKLRHGVWEAKDTDDDLAKEVKKKFAVGYPKDNILFQAPERAILWQNGRQILDENISRPKHLVEALKIFFEYQPPEFEQWQEAVEEFKLRVPELATVLLERIRGEHRINRRFIQAFEEFDELCRQTINPNLSPQAVEEMLIQHLLTERIFRKVFDNPDFAERNIIAREIEKVITALTSLHFSRHEFLRPLDRFYGAIETTAATIDDFSQKQGFLNTVYENFFQGFSVKVADTHGIVYTPQPIVNFMVQSVQDILQREFGRSLSDEGVHILDPFVGTGNFIVHIMREIQRSKLPHKYAHELHCNEVMLLPYYIASMNIEHEYYEVTGTYQPFEGICLVDTFELAEEKQMPLFTQANTERVERQKDTPIFVIIGNPPYNANQQNEMDLNKNRQHPKLDERIRRTYIRDSISVARTTRKLLFDPYIKAIRFASDRIGDEGIVAFVTNNSFVEQLTFSGMRKHLAQDFDVIYVLDLGGNVRKNPKLSGTTHNVFGIQVGVSINIFVKKRNISGPRRAKIVYANVDEFWRREQKYDFLDEKECIGNIAWQEIQPDKKYNWLTEGMKSEFETFLPVGTKEAKAGQRDKAETIFHIYALGVSTNKDVWLYNFSGEELERNVALFCETYDAELDRWKRAGKPKDVFAFLTKDQTKIKWSSLLLSKFGRESHAEFDAERIRPAMYRPFTKQFLYFDKLLIDAPTLQQSFFPNNAAESENQVICLTGKASEKPFMTLMNSHLTDLHIVGAGCGSQCFPFYTYDEDGSNRRENITDWALAQFRTQYHDDRISKRDIFHYVYAILHHAQYREKYAVNLRRELPRIPFAPDFWGFAEAGARLTQLHVHYEEQTEYPLKWLENKDVQLNWRVEKMKLSKDKTQLIYNDFLTLSGIPSEAFEYRLGNRSALEWIIDQYRVKIDKRSGIGKDPNRLDDPEYIIRLIGKVIAVSLETVKIVKSLPTL